MSEGVLSIKIFTALVVVVFVVAIGILSSVLVKGKQRIFQIQFTVAIISLLAWLGSAYAAFLPTFSSSTTFLSRASLSTAVVMNFIFLSLLSTIRREKFDLKGPLLGFAIFSALLLPLSYTSLLFIKSELINGSMYTEPGPLIFLFLIQALCSLCGSVYSLLRARLEAVGEKKGRITLLLWGFCAMYCGFLFTILIPIILTGNASYVPFGALYILLFLFVTAVCAVRYELFSLRLVSVEVLVFALNMFLLFVVLTAESRAAFRVNLGVFIFSLLVSVLFIRMARSEARLAVEHTKFAALEEANKKLKALDLQKSEFLALAAHHLRTPLSVVSGYIDLIKNNAYGKVTTATKKTLDLMEQNNSHLVRLVDEFLDISNIEQDKIQYHFAEFDIAQLTADVVKELQLKADVKDIQIVLNKTEETFVKGDSPKIRHALYNMIDNAIKYSSKDKVHVVLATEGRGVAVRVVDNGLGFTKEDEPSLFTKFYRGKNIEKEDVTGTGLGLFITKKYIEAHKGHVWAKSAGVGKGSEFGFWLPA